MCHEVRRASDPSAGLVLAGARLQHDGNVGTANGRRLPREDVAGLHGDHGSALARPRPENDGESGLYASVSSSGPRLAHDRSANQLGDLISGLGGEGRVLGQAEQVGFDGH